MSKTTQNIIGIICAPLIVVFSTLVVLSWGIAEAIHFIMNSLKTHIGKFLG